MTEEHSAFSLWPPLPIIPEPWHEALWPALVLLAWLFLGLSIITH